MDEEDVIFTPSDFVSYLTREMKASPDDIRIPSRLLITYQRRIYKYAKKLVGGKRVDWWIYDNMRPLCIGEYNGVPIGIDNIWVGAPAAAMTLEELIVCGAKTIFEVGFCGGLQPFLQPGDIVVVTDAIRDEGTSHHYLPSELRVESSPDLRVKLTRELDMMNIDHHIGGVWTTDGVYRETREKYQRFRDIGCLGVNMETSAIFAVAQFRGVKVASAQIISDILSDTDWQTHFFGHINVKKNTKKLVKATLKALSDA